MREAMVTKWPGPDVNLGTCADCHRDTRTYELLPDHWLCLDCYRDLVDAVLDTADEEDPDDAP